MVVTRLGCQNFRNLRDGELFPCPGVNVIYGGNAQGKTNLLEGLWLFTGGHSFRGAKDVELPRLDTATGENAPTAALALDFFSEGREQKALLQFENGRRSSVINGVKKKTGSALVGKVCAVIFSPEHLLLVKEGPARRRGFLDGALCQIRPSYAGMLHVYQRALSQRNALLKDIGRFPELRDTLEVWDARLNLMRAGNMMTGVYAAAIHQRDQTEGAVVYISQAQEIYRGISRGKEELSLSYAPSPRLPEGSSQQDWIELFKTELRRTEASDVRSGFTSVGPHRDDLEITLGGLSARMYGSQGQQRSAVLALKLAEAQALSQLTGETPIVLLDDVMSELDQSRQDYLLNHLHGRQVFITCCDPGTVRLMERGCGFLVERGDGEPTGDGHALPGGGRGGVPRRGRKGRGPVSAWPGGRGRQGQGLSLKKAVGISGTFPALKP